jgi:hypothetical protein
MYICVVFTYDEGGIPSGFVTIDRRVLPSDRARLDALHLTPSALCKCTVPLSKFQVRTTGSIEDAAGELQADFANKYIGTVCLFFVSDE